MDRVIAPIADGVVKVDDSFIGKVNYLIFEIADGDLRAQLAAIERSEITWRLRALHHIATGLHQLHGAGVAHQDVKPSNVLNFGPISKIADLGCVSRKGITGPRDGKDCAGDRAYAPPESLYGYHHPEFNVRRFGCDAYLLGSLVVFLFAGVSATAGVLSHLAPDHQPRTWTGAYVDVLPYVRNAFGAVIEGFASQIARPELRVNLVEITSQLCDPDPLLRGHPRNRIGFGNQYSLERFVTRFDVLALRSRLGLFK